LHRHKAIGGKTEAKLGEERLRAARSRRGLISITSLILFVLLGSTLPGSKSARAQTSEPTTEQLQKEIRQRDAIIRSLVRRVEKLERQVGTGASASASPAAAATRPAASSQPAARPPAPTVTALETEAPAPAPATPSTPPASSAGATPQAADTNPPAPGQFEVSPEAAERALERTLVATGNLLVPKGFAEVEPLLSYTRRENPSQILFNVNRNEFSWALDMRFGLPWESQFEIALPYNLAQQQVNNVLQQPVTDIAVAPPQQFSNSWGNSFGDVTVGLAKIFVHESGWIPDLLGRVTYEIPTGPENSNQVALPSRRSLLGFSLTGTKRQDPLVFVVTGGYSRSFSTGKIDLGDQANLLTGAFLATSPETSLRAVLQENFVQAIRVHDLTLRGSDTVQSILTFGASSILGRGALIDLQVGIGLTTFAPKYTVILSGTYRFATGL
jgi:hypothetical protein